MDKRQYKPGIHQKKFVELVDDMGIARNQIASRSSLSAHTVWKFYRGRGDITIGSYEKLMSALEELVNERRIKINSASMKIIKGSPK